MFVEWLSINQQYLDVTYAQTYHLPTSNSDSHASNRQRPSYVKRGHVKARILVVVQWMATSRNITWELRNALYGILMHARVGKSLVSRDTYENSNRGKNTNCFALFSWNKPRYHVEVKCQWFYLKISFCLLKFIALFILIKTLNENTSRWVSNSRMHTLQALGLNLVSNHPSTHYNYFGVTHHTQEKAQCISLFIQFKDWSLFPNVKFKFWVG